MSMVRERVVERTGTYVLAIERSESRWPAELSLAQLLINGISSEKCTTLHDISCQHLWGLAVLESAALIPLPLLNHCYNYPCF